VLLTTATDGVVRLWSETGMAEPLGFYMCCVVDSKTLYGPGAGRVAWLTQKIMRYRVACFCPVRHRVLTVCAAAGRRAPGRTR
jgi:hypothetical protein